MPNATNRIASFAATIGAVTILIFSACYVSTACTTGSSTNSAQHYGPGGMVAEPCETFAFFAGKGLELPVYEPVVKSADVRGWQLQYRARAFARS